MIEERYVDPSCSTHRSKLQEGSANPYCRQFVDHSLIKIITKMITRTVSLPFLCPRNNKNNDQNKGRPTLLVLTFIDSSVKKITTIIIARKVSLPFPCPRNNKNNDCNSRYFNDIRWVTRPLYKGRSTPLVIVIIFTSMT